MNAIARHASTFLALSAAVFLLHCGGSTSGVDGSDVGVSVASGTDALTGCHHDASSTIPASGKFELTSFGFSSGDDGIMACGEYTHGGNWYYAASRQRFGCGSHIQIQANGKCVVAETDDYGPDVCVENAAGLPIIDASPLVSEHLFGVKSAGWSDRLLIQVTEVDKSTPLGPCAASTTTSGSGSANATANGCSSDADCNGGQIGSETICSSNACVTGCHADTDCSEGTTCQSDNTCQ